MFTDASLSGVEAEVKMELSDLGRHPSYLDTHDLDCRLGILTDMLGIPGPAGASCAKDVLSKSGVDPADLGVVVKEQSSSAGSQRMDE